VLFTVCLFFCSSESFEKFGLPPEKKTGGKLWAGPPIQNNDLDRDGLAMVVDDNCEFIFEGRSYRLYTDYV
jgi:hypothetical protein